MVKLSQNILRLLIQNKEKEYTIRNISGILGVDYKNTYDSVMSMKHTISIQKKGQANFISFIPKLTSEVFEVEMLRKEELCNLSNINIISEDIKSIKNPFFIAIMFGSYAKGEQTKGSDIDMCIICDEEKTKQSISSALAIHPNIDLHFFTSKEFISMLKTKQFNVGHEIMRHGVIMYNIETYYKLMCYA